jgi:hypothetical protein
LVCRRPPQPIVYDFAYSFVLNDARDEAAFMLAYGDMFRAMGINILFFESGADEFWATAGPIVLGVTINLIAFLGSAGAGARACGVFVFARAQAQLCYWARFGHTELSPL